jgi:16S rRNA (uracil1498-N3)-methyltransferase
MRRIYFPNLSVGQVELPAAQAHHLRDVVRVGRGQQIELFDGQGAAAVGQIVDIDAGRVVVRVDQINTAPGRGIYLIGAAALPKGPRADWMIEKLGEIGVDTFVPLITQRSVVAPAGTKKHDRWNRLSAQAARQAGRSDVMRIEPPTALADLLGGHGGQKWYLSPDAAGSVVEALRSMGPDLTLLIGPEGGWTAAEKRALDAAGAVGVRLTQTVLRVETAAVLVAGIVQSALTTASPPATIDQPGEKNSA